MPCSQSGSASASCTGVSRRASRLKPITCNASCRNRVSIRWFSANAVCFIGPQRPSCTIENDRSTQSATAALVRRSVSITSKSPTSSGDTAGGGDAAPAQRVGDRTRCVDRQFVAEHPRPAEPGRLVGRAGPPIVVVPRPRGLELGEHPTQGRLAEPAYRPGRQAQPVVAAGQEALLLQLALQIPQRPEVARRLRSEPLLQHLDIDVVQGRAGVRLGQLGLQRLQVGELGHRLDRRAVAQRLPAGPHPRRRVAVQAGSQRPQVVSELGHLGGEVGVGQSLAHQLTELFTLLGAQRCQHPLGRCLPPGQRVDQLLDGLGPLGEELAVLVHEVTECVSRVLVAGVRGEQRVQVGEHVLDPLHHLGISGLQGPLHPGELGVQHLALQHLLDRLVRRARVRRAPGVGVQCADRAGDVVGQRVQLQLGEAGVFPVEPRQGLPLGGQGLVQGGPDLVEGATESLRAAEPAPGAAGGARRAGQDRRAPPGRVPAARAANPAGCRPPADRGRSCRPQPGRRTAVRADPARRARSRSGSRGAGRVLRNAPRSPAHSSP